MGQISIQTIENSKIRKVWDDENNLWQFSIIDTVGLLTNSTDARNYWKVLKSRLKNTHPELVTSCNQLKMRSSDGKYYNTDAGSRHTMMKIIAIIAPAELAIFDEWMNKIEHEKSLDALTISPKYEQLDEVNYSPIKINIESPKEFIPSPINGSIKVDGFIQNNEINFIIDISSCDPDELFISLKCNELILKGARVNEYISKENYKNINELSWGKFARVIRLPQEIDTENISATEKDGLLKINAKLLDKEKSKIVKIKSL